jgi:TRAP-type C4-dicarboxylate transport system substrate-binding protein
MLAGTAAAQTELRFAHQFPTTHFASKISIEPFAKAVEEKSGGRLRLKVFPAEQLAKAGGLLDAIKNRVADAGFVGVTYVTEKMPLTSVVEIPGLFGDVRRGYGAYEKLMQEELMQLEHLPYGVRPLYGAVTPPYQLVLRKQMQLDDIGALAGLKLRVPGATGALAAEAIGAVPVRLPPSDLYLGLERGTVDGAIQVSASVDSLKLQEVSKTITTNAGMGTVAFVTFINEDVWQGLPPDLQKVLVEAGAETGAKGAAVFDGVNAKAYKGLEEAGMSVITLSPKVEGQFAERLQAVEKAWLEDVGRRSPHAAEILARYKELVAAQAR